MSRFVIVVMMMEEKSSCTAANAKKNFTGKYPHDTVVLVAMTK